MHSYSTDIPLRKKALIVFGVVVATLLSVATSAFGVLGALPPVACATIAYIVFNRWAWRWNWVPTKVPDLNGRWNGYLYTSGPEEKIDDELIVEEGKQRNGLTKMEAELRIEQRWDAIQISLVGPESRSSSKAASILVDDGAWPTLNYNYENSGSPSNDDLQGHYGTATLELYEEEQRLEGIYYNEPDRDRWGVLELDRSD